MAGLPRYAKRRTISVKRHGEARWMLGPAFRIRRTRYRAQAKGAREGREADGHDTTGERGGERRACGGLGQAGGARVRYPAPVQTK